MITMELKYRLEGAWIRTRAYASVGVILGLIGVVLLGFYAMVVAMSTTGSTVTMFGLTVTESSIGDATVMAQTQVVFAGVAAVVCGTGAVLAYA